MSIERFNIRVYGLLFNENHVMVCDEERMQKRFTKFPGGALEYGEGMRDALIREWKEETNTNVEVTEHVYTTDFFQQSAFDKRQQLISVYFKIKLLEPFKATVSTEAFELMIENPEAISWRWLELNEKNENELTFPIDKLVFRQLLTR